MGLEQKRTEEGSAPISSFHTHLPRGSKKESRERWSTISICTYLRQVTDSLFPRGRHQTKERR